MIIAICNTKGGVGKSTVAVHLAAAFSKKSTVLLIDTDAQQTAAKWAEWRRDGGLNDLTTITLQGQAVAKEGVALAKNYGVVIIDAGGGNQPGLRAALAVCNVAIVPIGASEFDTAAMNDFIELLELAKPLNPAMQVCAVLNGVSRTKETDEVNEFLKQAAMPVFKTRLHERVAYRRACAAGRSVEEVKVDEKASLEMRAFVDEVTILIQE